MSSESSLESAAMKFVKEIYNTFKESIILLRTFVAIQYGELPNNVQRFADNLAATANLKLYSNSYVLTLFGTIGKDISWHNRIKSKGHQGIPLATADFVKLFPMISVMMEQLKFDLGWLRGEPAIVAQHIGKLMGTFYVEDASTSKDSNGRIIISAQDFVRKYGVKSIFGFGGGYAVGGKMSTIICFLNEKIEKLQAVAFLPLSAAFVSATQNLITGKKYF